MKHRWTTLLWELWAAQAVCAAAVPTAWAAWALFAEPPDPLPPERLLGPVSKFDLAALCDLEQPAAVP